VAHLDRVEVAHVDADSAQDAATKIDLERVDDLPPAALLLGVKRIVLHLGAHAQRGAGAYADHAAGAVRLADPTVPQKRGKAHEAVVYIQPLAGVRVLGRNGLAQRRLQRHHEPFQETYHCCLTEPGIAGSGSAPANLPSGRRSRP